MVIAVAQREISDDALARMFIARAPLAFDETYRRYAGTLATVARSVLGSTQDAQDCVHDVLLRVWLKSGSYRLERGSLRAYLNVAVRNEALTRRRDAARHFAIERRVTLHALVDEEAAPEIADHVELGRLRSALAALPIEQRVVIEHAYFANESQSEIATRLAVPLGTVKSRAVLALRKLALAMAAQRPERQS